MEWPRLAAWLIAALLVLAAVAALTGLVLRWLERRAVLDHPGPRSSHELPTPRGGGIAVLAVLLPAWAVLALLEGGAAAGRTWPVLAAALLLAAVSWVDDLRPLSAAWRLPVHVLAVAIGSIAAGEDMVFQGLLPGWLDLLAAGLFWLWFLNLFNFMDGIDGISGTEAMSVGAGLALVLLVAPGTGGDALPLAGFGLTLAAAAAGFLWWNRPPARLFLGDVGSIPLGFLMGWLLLEAARGGAWAAALILPAFYLVDASWTLAVRLARGISPLEPHAEHVYQRAVREKGRSHGQVVAALAVANLALIALALGAEREGERLAALAGAAAVVALLIRRLLREPAR
ncbi:MAG: glycosyl transferase [Alphaproteobacteria bacterium]|nr:MAG: glycosyl transferase [Alphaproteobacteria bacterium]